MRRKFNDNDRQYWGQAAIALSQISFAAAWALMFTKEFDTNNMFLVILNGIITVFLLLTGWIIYRRI